MSDFFKAFTRFENTPYTPDPELKIAEGRIQVRQKELSKKLQEILTTAAFQGEEKMRSLAPENTGELKKSIRVFPNTLETGGVLPFTRGGYQRGVGPGGVSRRIEIRVGEGVPYAGAVIGGSRRAEPEEGKYVVFSPYTVGAKSIVFKKNREKLYENRVNAVTGKKNVQEGVLIFSSRSAIAANDFFVTEGVRTANRYVSRQIKKLD